MCRCSEPPDCLKPFRTQKASNTIAQKIRHDQNCARISFGDKDSVRVGQSKVVRTESFRSGQPLSRMPRRDGRKTSSHRHDRCSFATKNSIHASRAGSEAASPDIRPGKSTIKPFCFRKVCDTIACSAQHGATERTESGILQAPPSLLPICRCVI